MNNNIASIFLQQIDSKKHHNTIIQYLKETVDNTYKNYLLIFIRSDGLSKLDTEAGMCELLFKLVAFCTSVVLAVLVLSTELPMVAVLVLIGLFVLVDVKAFSLILCMFA